VRTLLQAADATWWLAARGAGPHRWDGAAWRFAGRGLPTQVAECLAIADDSQSLYVGLYQEPLWISGDGGDSWQRSDSPRDIVAVAVEPGDPRTLYVGSYDHRTVAKSSDGGRTWERVIYNTGAPVACIVISPSHPDFVYVGTENSGDQGGLYASSDAGATWARIDPPAMESCAMAILVDADDPRHLIAGSQFWGVYETTDLGDRWSARNQGLTHRNIRSLAAADDHLQRIWAGTSLGGIYASSDGGAHWEAASEGLPEGLTVWTLAVGAGGDTLWAGSQQGTHLSGDGGLTWQPRDRALHGQFVVDLAHAADRHYAATESGFFHTLPGAPTTWLRAAAGLPEAEAISAIAAAGDTILATEGLKIYRSSDGGALWEKSSHGIAYFTGLFDLAFSPAMPERAFAATLHSLLLGGGIYRSDDGGLTWQAKNRGLGLVDFLPLEVHPDPLDSEILYTLVAYRGIYKSVNGGNRWSKTSHGLGLLPSVVTMAIAPGAPDLLFAGGPSGELHRSVDAAESWQLLDPPPGGGHIYGITIDPADPIHLILVTSAGLVASSDAGDTWEWFQPAPDAVSIPNLLSFDPFSGGPLGSASLYLGTAGQSLFIAAPGRRARGRR
jgi:photosystem II stability/assembly factor-like uncharacterized protein